MKEQVGATEMFKQHLIYFNNFQKLALEGDSPVKIFKLLCRTKVHPGLITHGSLGSIPKYGFKLMMWQNFNNFQIGVEAYITHLDYILFSLRLFFESSIKYMKNDFTHDLYTLNWASNLLNNWSFENQIANVYNGFIADEIAYVWLWKNGNSFEAATWAVYNFFFQCEKNMLFVASTSVHVKKTLLVCYLSPYYVNFLIYLIKYSFFFILFLNVLFFTRVTLKKLSWVNNTIFSKFFIFFEAEEEMGSVDDSLFFVSFFVLLFSWFFLTSLFFTNAQFNGLNFVLVAFVILVSFVLLIPLSVLLDFGLAFASYIRGAGSTTNVIVEILFDLIGTLVVFTRFVVQNIRFVMIFWAYFELFEWIYNSPFLNLFNQFFNIGDVKYSFSEQLDLLTGLYYFSIIIFGLLGYAYYFLHLIVLLFIQLGAYFLISFWLFFFFYTSFFLTPKEKYFLYKRYL